MLGFLFSSRKPTKGITHRRTRLVVEELEPRWCPSTITLEAEVLTGHRVHLSGAVTDASPGPVAVTFSGAVAAETTTDSGGYFDFMTEDASLGTVYGVGVDQDNESTDTASATIAVDAPGIYLAVLSVTQTDATVFGHLHGIDPAGQTVTISGIADDSVTFDSDGNFVASYNISASGTLYAAAAATDVWGQSVPTAGIDVTIPSSITPHITLSALVLTAHGVQLTGTVTDDNPAAVVVTFSGAVNGTTTTDADGNFIFTTADAELGTVYADGVDQAAQATDTASATIATDAPVITLTISALTHDTVTIAGSLTGVDCAGQTIAISGVAEGSVITGADGSFLITTSLAGTGTIQATATDLWAQAAGTAETTVDSLPTASPSQLTLSAQALAGHQVQLTGTVIGAYIAGVTVFFSGSVSGSTTTDSDGHYSFTTSYGSVGTIYAIDSYQQSADTVATLFAVPTSALSFKIASISGNTVAFTGKLTGADAAGKTIAIGGAVAETVTTDGDGNFSFTEDRATVGTLTASATDEWGQTFCAAPVNMPEYPPGIRNFNASCVDGYTYLFRGRVLGDDVATLVVDFGGLDGLIGRTATVAGNGNFYLYRTLNPTDFGTATAQVTDAWGRLSNLACASVSF